jgi:hypothetical protein
MNHFESFIAILKRWMYGGPINRLTSLMVEPFKILNGQKILYRLNDLSFLCAYGFASLCASGSSATIDQFAVPKCAMNSRRCSSSARVNLVFDGKKFPKRKQTRFTLNELPLHSVIFQEIPETSHFN